MKHLVALIFALTLVCSAHAQTAYTPSPKNLAARRTFSDARFGIFIHWGIYSMLGQGEWVLQNEPINYNEYARLARGFNPAKFDAQRWVEAIKAGGAKYICITSRHHDGFSMFDSHASAYNIKQATPFARDVIGELAAACQREGLLLNLYYSHLDWGRTDYYPRGRTGLKTERPDGTADSWAHYLRFMNEQLTELLTSYGPIGAIWFDGMWDMDGYKGGMTAEKWNLDEQYALIHRLQPACLVGNNHHITPFAGEDIQIFERDIPGRNDHGLSGQVISALPLETCQTMNSSWGYRITDHDYKSSDDLIRYLVRTAGKGANLLLNIGPRPDGTLPEEAIERLSAIGSWLKTYGETIYGTEGGVVEQGDWGATTQHGNKLYVHILSAKTPRFILPYYGQNRLKEARVFTDKRPLKFKVTECGVMLYLPETPTAVDYVVELTFADPL